MYEPALSARCGRSRFGERRPQANGRRSTMPDRTRHDSKEPPNQRFGAAVNSNKEPTNHRAVAAIESSLNDRPRTRPGHCSPRDALNHYALATMSHLRFGETAA